MRLAEVVGGGERGAQGQELSLRNIFYWGQEEPEPLKELKKEWFFTLLPNMRLHLFTSLRGSDIFISGGFRGR